MKLLLLLLAFSFTAPESTEPVTSENASTSVFHYRNSVSVTNYDGTQSRINVSGNSATLFNPDGSQLTISRSGRNSTIVSMDGTVSSVIHNGMASTVYNSDGTQAIVSHMQSTSSCVTEFGKHSVTHTFGNFIELCHKEKIDVLLHRNWFIQRKAAKTASENNEEELEK